MLRHVKSLLIFFLFFFTTVVCLAMMSSLTSYLPNRGTWDETLSQPVELTNLLYNSEIGGYEITIHGLAGEKNYSLALNNNFLDIWQDDKQLHQSSTRGDNQYLTTLTLLKPQDSSTLHLTIYANPPADHHSILSYSGHLKPSIWLAETAVIDRLIQSASELQLLLLGAYVSLFVFFFLLYILKRKEGYLLNAALIALAQGFITISFMNTQLIHLPYSFYRIVRSAMYNMPLALIVYICISTFRSDIHSPFSRLISPWTFGFFTLFAITISRFMNINSYQLMHRLYILPVVYSFSCGFQSKRKGALSLLIAYAIAEGLPYYLNLIDVLPNTRRGLIVMFFRPSQYQYLPFLICYLLQSIGRFTHDFIDTEISLEYNQQENSRFEALVAQRTAELIAEQQRRNNMMLKIFHDLRSPIYVMRSGLSRLNLADEASGIMLKSIQSRLSYLERLTENLFLSAKMDENEVLYDMDFVHLDQLIQRIVSSSSVMAQERKVSLSLKITECCTAWGDALRLQQAFHNIVDNAIFYSRPEGFVQISLTRESGFLSLRVRDNGIGIADEDINRIFERYYRSKTRKQSSGLGLYISKEIIEKHGGTIHVCSVLSKGSEFTIILPECLQEEENND